MTDTAHPPTLAALDAAVRSTSDRLFWPAVGVTAAAAAAFLAHQLMAWPPHEDETLALFVGRDSLAGVVEHVTRERGGAPLHFVIAWLVAHLDLGLGALRLVSAALAVASLPPVALLVARLADRRVAIAATVLTASSWAFLFHGVYARMYSLFLCTSLLTMLALLRALERRGAGPWALFAAASLAMVAAHPYGALVLAGLALFVVLAHRDRWRAATAGFAAVALLGIPFWLTNLVLAGRFDVGVGGGGARLGDPGAVAAYLWRTAGDFSAGWWPVLLLVLALAAVGLAAVPAEARLFALALLAAPTAAFLAARLGGSTSPESRHLVFLLPLLSMLVAAGVVRVSRPLPALAPLLVAALLVAEIAWAWQRTPQLFEWEPDRRQAARAEAEAWLAARGRPDDVLFGYEPLYLGAWERDRGFSHIVVPRADSVLALRVLRRRAPLGRGVWVLDASKRNNLAARLEIERRTPAPADAFESAVFGPFLVILTRERLVTPDAYLLAAARVQLVGRSLGIGDADVNMATVERADRALRGYGPSLRSRSSSSR